MDSECDLLATCGFFKKYQPINDHVCNGLIILYCKGSLKDKCKRKQYREQNGIPPPDDMMPGGQMMDK